MLRVMRNHRLGRLRCRRIRRFEYQAAGYQGPLLPRLSAQGGYQGLDEAVQLGEKYGYRNAQATVIAPTGTIGLVMDCDTTGVEPDFALVQIQETIRGGYFKIINQSVPTGP